MVAATVNSQIMFVMDGDRQAIYRDAKDSGALVLNRMAEEIARERDLRFINLHPLFREEWQFRRKRFDYESDNHWNEDGHALAAKAILRAMQSGQ